MTILAIVGLAGCAIAIVAVVLDWRWATPRMVVRQWDVEDMRSQSSIEDMRREPS